MNDKASMYIGEGLMNFPNLVLLDLDISNNRLNDHGGEYITKAIGNLNRLRDLDL